MNNIRNSFIGKVVVVFLVQSILFQIIFPLRLAALTGGPAPESTGYSPIGLDNMVSTVNGDFSYQVSLMQVGDIPLSINYAAGASVEGEASVVGSNWSPSWSAINRQMNGIPDEFNGEDKIKKKFYRKSNWTFNLGFSFDVEPFTIEIKDELGNVLSSETKGKFIPEVGLNLSFNNYSGFEVTPSVSPSGAMNFDNGLGLSGELSVGLGSKSGLSVNANGGFSARNKKDSQKNNSLVGGLNSGLGFNSRAGMTSFSMGVDLGYSVGGTAKRGKYIDDDKNVAYKTIQKTAAKLGIGSPGSYSFSVPSFVPSYENSMSNMNASIAVKFGATLFGVFGSAEANGAYSMQWVAEDDRERDLSAYGFMYAHKAEGDGKRLMDFNREKDAGGISKEATNLALTKESFDIYSVSAPGMGGSYRTTRSDIGLVKDANAVSRGGGGGVDGFDFGGGNITDQGMNVKGNWSNSKSGVWEKKNDARSTVEYQSSGFDGYEPFYFKQAGEFVVESDPNFLLSQGSEHAVMLDMDNNPGFSQSVLKPQWRINYGDGSNNEPILPILKNKRTIRERRNSTFQMLKANEAKYVGLNKKIGFYNSDSNDPSAWTEIDRESTSGDSFSKQYKSHHPSEIQVTGADGKRGVFGVPSYVLKHKEVTFSTEKGGSGNVCKNGIIDFDPSEDKINNNKREEFYQSNEMSPYANSYLLSGIVSSDYVDKTGNGISDDDHGSATKVNYFRHSRKYGYRTPFSGAYFNEGIKEFVSDDKASFTYGEKEIWYVKEMISRTSIAIFEYGERQDGHGALEIGGVDLSEPLLYVKKISLYSRPEYEGAVDKSLATPIKVANFEYDYSLCLGANGTNLPNNKGDAVDSEGNVNQGGKLTLKRVFFTYGKSKKGKVSPYVFYYNINPAYYYGEKSSDRWGSFKPNEGTVCTPNSPLNNQVFPYTKQDDITNEYVGLWSMNKIETPSGGTIEVEYESDDYAYVQDKRAMQMTVFTGFGANPSDPLDGENLYLNANKYNVKLTGDPGLDVDVTNFAGDKNYAFFKLQKSIPVNSTDIKNTIKEQYLLQEDKTMMESVFFKALVDMGAPGTLYGEGIYEYVQGYAGIKSWGVHAATALKDGEPHYTHGYIELQPQEISETYGGTVNPISKTAWQFSRLSMPSLAYNQAPSMGEGGGLRQIVGQFTSIMTTLVDLISGFNFRMKSQGYCNNLKPGKSFMRLYSPTKAKKGGGHRVKKLVIKDNWKTISGSSNYVDADYGQIYDYTMEEDGETISSGVAQNEPPIGGDENPMRIPNEENFTTKKRVLAPDDRLYQEGPFGESFMPGASVAYRRVKVSNLPYAGVTLNATGHVVHEQYTAYEFPVKFKQTSIDLEPGGSPFSLRSLIGLKATSLEASQGYVIETNNMHGMKRAERIFNAVDDEISSVEYVYNVELEKSANGKLVKTSNLLNTVSTIGKDGIVREELIGVEVETVTDTRWSEATSQSAGLNLNNNNSLYGPLPVVLISLIPKYNRTETASKIAVVTKHVNRLGVLTKTIARDLGSEVETKNLLYDRESGQVLLTETQNQFNDPVFNFQYPAHWVYDEMGPGYQNIGYRKLYPGGDYVSDLNEEMFFLGDELLIKANGIKSKYWVSKTSPLEIQNANGVVLTDLIKELLVTRSGARNLHTTPVGSVTSLSSPIVNGKFALADKTSSEFKTFYSSILNASGMEFVNDWKTFCNCEYADYDTWNVFKNARLGGWRPKRSYVYLTNRTQSQENANTNIRIDGVFKDFSPFWEHQSDGTWAKTNSDQWTFVEEISIYSPLGQELERVNALGIYSSSVFGYNRLLPTGVAGNAEYREIGEDNFEDAQFNPCTNDHFSYKYYSKNYVETRAHTGRYSLFVPAGLTYHVTKIIELCKVPKSPSK